MTKHNENDYILEFIYSKYNTSIPNSLKMKISIINHNTEIHFV